MAADFNLTNQYISQSFENLIQDSGSIPVDGLGNQINNLTVTASKATNADSASFFGDGIVTASAVASTITFTKDNGTVFDITVAQSGSVESASYAATATSASHALFADLAADANDLIVGVKNTLGVTITKGQTLHATGVTGQNIDVITASCDSNMPAIGLALTDINASATGNAIISGKIVGVDTSTKAAGEPVYVGQNGSLTGTKPTGSALIQNIGIVGKVDASDGEIVVMGAGRTNDLPNLTTDYVWKGDANGVPQAVASSSIIPTTANTASYVAGANVDGTVASATSASFATNSNTTISASHAVQADSSITATSATTATSASHAVQADSAISSSHAVIADSALSSNTSTSASHAVNADTASFLPSSTRLNITDITASNASFTSASIGYLQTITGSATIIGDEYIILNADSPTKRFAGIKVYDSGSGLTGSFEWDSVDDNWIQVETGGESAGMLTGPSGSKGSEVYPTANTLIKGTGNHTVVDTNITDDGSTVKINSNTQITGSLNVSAGITGSLLGTATTASYVENSQTASYVNTLNQDVTITGSLNVTSSLTMNGAFRNNISQQPNAFSQFDIITAPAFTKTQNPASGSSILYNSINYGNWGSGQENVWIIEQGNAAFTEFAQLSLGLGRFKNTLMAGNVQTQAVMDLVNLNDVSQSATEVRNYGSYMALGEYNGKQIQIGNSNRNIPNSRANQNIAIMGQDIYLGGTQDTSYTFRDNTQTFAGNTPTKDIKLDYTGSVYLRQSGSIAGTPALIVTGSVTATSFTGSLLGTASHAANAGDWDGSYTGTASITGSLIVSGGNFDVLGATRNGSSIDSNFKQNLASPGTNNQYDLIAVSPTTLDGRTYSNVNNFFADYSSFGTPYKDYFATEYYDSFSYNYGGEISVNGVQTRMNILPGNNQFGDFKVQQKKPADIQSGRGTVSGSHVIMQAGGTGSQALINAYNGATFKALAVGSQGGELAYMQFLSTGSISLESQGNEMSLRSGTDFGGNYIVVSGSVVQPVKTSGITSNTASISTLNSNFHTLTLVSGSDTHLKINHTGGGTARPGQTLSIEVKQPTTATDSYGTLSFAPEFKFAGGTAPTITAASGALDVLTFQTYDGTTFYGTAIQNFS